MIVLLTKKLACSTDGDVYVDGIDTGDIVEIKTKFPFEKMPWGTDPKQYDFKTYDDFPWPVDKEQDVMVIDGRLWQPKKKLVIPDAIEPMYYAQVQGNLHIREKRKCWLFYWTPSSGCRLHLVEPNNIFWREAVPRLQEFRRKVSIAQEEARSQE